MSLAPGVPESWPLDGTGVKPSQAGGVGELLSIDQMYGAPDPPVPVSWVV